MLTFVELKMFMSVTTSTSTSAIVCFDATYSEYAFKTLSVGIYELSLQQSHRIKRQYHVSNATVARHEVEKLLVSV
jgi:hypothetical protein